MALQKVANCCVAAHFLDTAAYLSTPHSSKCAHLAFDDFCLAIPKDDFLRDWQGCLIKTVCYATRFLLILQLRRDDPHQVFGQSLHGTGRFHFML